MALAPAVRRSLGTVASRGSPLFLGLDSSTQGVKAIVVDGSTLEIVAKTAVNYAADFESYDLGAGGVHHEDGGVVTQPTIMYLEALDTVLLNLAKDVDLGDVAAVSGSGQQHGSAYWRKGASDTLASLSSDQPLVAQVDTAFSLGESPIWMDSSTTTQCQELESAMGGPMEVAKTTGSRAYERFTGNQIRKVATTKSAAYDDCERISLISSLLASVLGGAYAPIDFSDGSGMNLFDINKKAWADAYVEFAAPDLRRRLGEPVPSHAVYGSVHSYFAQRHGFNPACQLVAWSGDNPNSVAGLGLGAPGDIALSLGTSDTLFGIMGEAHPSTEGHVFVNPVDPESYMAMLCYKNGSLTREHVRDAVCGGDWGVFDKMLATTPAGNGGNIGLFFLEPEITPDVPKPGVWLFDRSGAVVPEFSPEVTVRAVLEAQFLSMRLHARSIGLTSPARIIATGGASANKNIVQVASDVFGVPIVTAETPDSAALGAAYRACHGLACQEAGKIIPFADILERGTAAGNGPAAFKQIAAPNAAAHAVYTDMLDTYAAREAVVLKETTTTTTTTTLSGK